MNFSRLIIFWCNVCAIFFMVQQCYGLRNPFAFGGALQKKAAAHDIGLDAIMYTDGGSPAALLVVNGERNIVVSGDTFDGYLVLAIEKSRIILEQNSEQKIVYLEQDL